jgi:hypothetical protein
VHDPDHVIEIGAAHRKATEPHLHGSTDQRLDVVVRMHERHVDAGNEGVGRRLVVEPKRAREQGECLRIERAVLA